MQDFVKWLGHRGAAALVSREHMNKNDFPAPKPDALISALVDPGMSLTPEITAALRARLDRHLFQPRQMWRCWQNSVISGTELRDDLFKHAQSTIEIYTGIKVPFIEERFELALFGERLADLSEPPIPPDDDLESRLAEKAKLAELEEQDLIKGAVQKELLFKDVAQDLEKRPPSRAAAQLVVDAYRRGEADAWLTALLLGACRDKSGYATVREILLLPGRAGSGHAGSALAKIGGHSALQDLIYIMNNAPDRRSRQEAAYGIEALGLPEAAPAMVDAVLSGKIPKHLGVGVFATFPDEGVVLRLLDSPETTREELATNIVARCLETIPVPALVSRPSPELIEALERVLSDPNITISPKKRSCIRSWLDIRGSTKSR